MKNLYEIYSLRYYSDEKVLNFFRMKLHALEKSEIDQSLSDVYLIKKYYQETKKRDILSKEEDSWARRILFCEVESQSEGNIKNSDLDKIIKNRRSVRNWGERKLSDQQFENLIEAARWAPSSQNRQPWKFILTRDDEKINQLAELRGQKFLKDAPNCILVLINKDLYHIEKEEYTIYLDAGAAIENILLKTEDMNLSACWINYGLKQVELENQKKTKNIFDVPRNFRVVSLIAIGKSEFKPNSPGRRKIEEILSVEKQNNF